MPLADREKDDVKSFFTAQPEIQNVYLKNAGLSYFAVKDGKDFVLYQSVFFLNSAATPVPHSHFESAHIRAGHYALSELGVSVQELVDQLLTGAIDTPGGKLLFPPDENGMHSAYYAPFHPDGLENGNRLDMLTIGGSRQKMQLVKSPQYDWEVKAAATPYDSLAELLQEYCLGRLQHNALRMEIIAYNVAVVDAMSTIAGVIAKPMVILADGLSTDKFALGFRVFSNGKVVERNVLSGTDMKWESRDKRQYGVGEISVPSGAVLHAVVSYAGVAQSQSWIADPSTVQNPRRAAYEGFDDKLEVLMDFLTKTKGKGRDARDLEIGVAWLLWMLGFGAAHLGGTDKTQAGPDLIVTTPSGHFAVVECTTGLLKSEHKLAQLIERSELLKRRLDASGNRQLHVLPVMVTTKTRVDIKAEMVDAEKHGVVVLTHESLQEAVNRTLIVPDAERIYSEGVRIARDGQAKHAPPSSPFPPTNHLNEWP